MSIILTIIKRYVCGGVRIVPTRLQVLRGYGTVLQVAKVTKEAIEGCVSDQRGWVSHATSLWPSLPHGMAHFLQATCRFPFPLHAVKKERYSGPQKLMTPWGE